MGAVVLVGWGLCSRGLATRWGTVVVEESTEGGVGVKKGHRLEPKPDGASSCLAIRGPRGLHILNPLLSLSIFAALSSVVATAFVFILGCLAKV
ncbi:hypothetical protein CCACVL1_00191 [Corchorus capsularis]|uniref:Uncharacterized protein n=1 Tax=Corchorus capsularis TaxID=210143 RepID=A0A1R3KY01_COCAP|nr:hypothetical protein CCACVL1_00191 [Corchorus capsularis]